MILFKIDSYLNTSSRDLVVDHINHILNQFHERASCAYVVWITFESFFSAFWSVCRVMSIFYNLNFLWPGTCECDSELPSGGVGGNKGESLTIFVSIEDAIGLKANSLIVWQYFWQRRWISKKSNSSSALNRLNWRRKEELWIYWIKKRLIIFWISDRKYTSFRHLSHISYIIPRCLEFHVWWYSFLNVVLKPTTICNFE